MKNFKSQGNTLTFTAGAAYSSGDGVLVGTIFGVAAGDIANGAEGVINLDGVYELTKAASQAWTVGAPIYWDATGAKTTNVADGNTLIGSAVLAVGSGAGETLGQVRLNAAFGGEAVPGIADFTMAAAAGAANVTEVTVTAKDASGNTITEPLVYDLWLSDAATGAGLTGTTASGTVTAKSASGAVMGTLTAKKALRVQTLATGVFILEITDTAKTAFKVAGGIPGSGKAVVGITLATGDYG